MVFWVKEGIKFYHLEKLFNKVLFISVVLFNLYKLSPWYVRQPSSMRTAFNRDITILIHFFLICVTEYVLFPKKYKFKSQKELFVFLIIFPISFFWTSSKKNQRLLTTPPDYQDIIKKPFINFHLWPPSRIFLPCIHIQIGQAGLKPSPHHYHICCMQNWPSNQKTLQNKVFVLWVYWYSNSF